MGRKGSLLGLLPPPFFLLYFILLCVLSVGISTMYVLVPAGGKFSTLELELQMTVSYHRGV